jgi:hypothetical protein
MAVLKGEVTFKVSGFAKLLKVIPDLNGSYLAYIGKRGRQILRDKFFRGQELDYSKQRTKDGFPIDKRGRFTITSNVDKRQTKTTLSSYPANLFEHGRILRSGRKEAGKKIITGKLKREVSANIQRYATQYENRFVKKALKGINL